MLLKVKTSSPGFTLVELMVSVAIIGLLSAFTLVNFNSYTQRSKVDTAAYKLASDIRTVQNYAMSMKEFGVSVPAGGWGLRSVEGENEYIIYADLEKVGEAWHGKYTEAEKFQTISLNGGVVIEEIDIGGATNRDYSYINNIPPNPDIVINGAENENNDNLQISGAEYIEITLSNDGHTRKVIVNKFGLVDVE
jgi:prepilin-type N-terminal cleavage/methylation domain-containing protein